MKNHSTNLYIIEVVGSILEITDERNYAIGLYLESPKAFDTIDLQAGVRIVLL